MFLSYLVRLSGGWTGLYLPTSPLTEALWRHQRGREVKRMVIGANGIQWNPSGALTPQSVFIQLTRSHRVQRDTCSPGSDGGGDSWDGRMWEETEAGGRGSLFFFQVSCNVQLRLEHILFPVFMVCDDICLNDCDLSLYCICFNCCELPVFLFWRSSWPVSCPDLPLLHVWLVWLNISWVYLFCSAGLYFIHDL